MFWDELKGRLGATPVAYAEPLATKTTLRVGGAADYYAEPEDVEALQVILKHAHCKGVPVFVLGRGSNILVRDSGYQGCVVRLKGPFWSTCSFLPDGTVHVGAGLRLKELCAKACKAGWAGLEFLEGIPGSVGGALFTNAGAMGGWMHDSLVRVEAVDLDGTRAEYSQADLEATYRSCPKLKAKIVTQAWICPSGQAPQAVIAQKLNTFASKRRATQPQQSSAGCMFKNPKEGQPPAGQLIDQLGLKGLSMGKAQVSEKHANFIVTQPGAQAQDVLALMEHIKARVFEAYGIELEREVHIL